LVTVGEPNFFVEDDVAAFGAERRDDGLREFLHALEQGLTSLLVEYELFCCHNSSGWFLR
jgi:hypothetical protein